MGFAFRIGLKDKAVLSLLNGRYWRAVGVVALFSLVSGAVAGSAMSSLSASSENSGRRWRWRKWSRTAFRTMANSHAPKGALSAR